MPIAITPCQIQGKKNISQVRTSMTKLKASVKHALLGPLWPMNLDDILYNKNQFLPLLKTAIIALLWCQFKKESYNKERYLSSKESRVMYHVNVFGFCLSHAKLSCSIIKW